MKGLLRSYRTLAEIETFKELPLKSDGGSGDLVSQYHDKTRKDLELRSLLPVAV
jgi:hypothetical protein